MGLRDLASLVVGLAFSSIALAASASDVDTFFGRNPGNGAAYACFVRHYGKAHLASHPRQNVTSMMLFVEKKAGTEPLYNLTVRLTFRQSKTAFHAVGSCSPSEDGRQALQCAIDCDGGELAVRTKDPNAVLVEVPYELRVSDPSSNADETDEPPKGARFGQDDQLFRLDRAAVVDCVQFIPDDDLKAKVLRGVSTD